MHSGCSPDDFNRQPSILLHCSPTDFLGRIRPQADYPILLGGACILVGGLIISAWGS
jgi:hypothetical protein